MNDRSSVLSREGRRTSGLTAAKPWLLAAVAILLVQATFFLGGYLPWPWFLFAPILPGAVLLGAFVAFARWDGRTLASYGFSLPRPLVPAVVLAVILTAIFGIALLEPGFSSGFVRLGWPSPIMLGVALLYAPVVALGQEAVFRGYVFGRLLTPGRFSSAVYPSAALFAVTSMNIAVLFAVPPTVGTEAVFVTIVPAFALGIVLAIYYLRTGRNLFGPVAFRTGVLLWTSLFPITVASAPWVVIFASELIAYGLVLMFVFVSTPGPKLLARKYLGERFGPKRDRFLQRMRQGRQVRRWVAFSICLAISMIALVAAVVVGLGTAHPFLAIESGSMAPTFVRGDLVVIQHVTASEIKVGTIVAYSTTCLPSPVVHRVIAVAMTAGGPVYTTKGDHNPTPDPCTVPYSAVLGRVVLILPVVGYFVLFPQFTIALLILAVVLAFLLGPQAPKRFPRRRSER